MEYTTQLLRKLHEKKRHLRAVFFICLFFLSTSALFLYYYNEHVAQQILIQQTQERDLVVSRAGEAFIAQFFGTIKQQLLALSVAPNVQTQVPGRTQILINDVFATHEKTDPSLFAMGFLSPEGTVTAIADQAGKTTTIGKNYAYREYFTWTKDITHKGQVYLSTPFVSYGPLTYGRSVMMMTTPVYDGSQYKGAVFALIVLDEFTKTYIAPLAVNSPEVWLVDSKGTLLAGGDGDEKVAMNFFTYAKQHSWSQENTFTAGLHDIFTKDEDMVHWFYRMQQGKVKEVYGVSNEFDVLGRKEWLVISSPKEQIIASVATPLALAAIPVFAVLATLILGFLFVFVVRFARKEVYMSGFLAGREAAQQETKKK